MIEFTESTYYTGPDVTDAMIAEAESRLGVRLPQAYVDLVRVRNGGEPAHHCCPVDFKSSWADDHIDIGAILGIGGTWGIDADWHGLPHSSYMVREWGYPPVGVVICHTPSGGHDTVMLDYSSGGREPSVIYVDEAARDEDRAVHQIAATFGEFLVMLIECPAADRLT